MSQPIQVNTYTRIPVSKQREFWTAQKIEHLRAIATTARAESLWEDHSESYRILDRIAFANTHPIKSNKEFQSSKNNLSLIKDIDTSVNLAYGRIKLKSPLYLGDMSFGALSGIPNIALARAADRGHHRHCLHARGVAGNAECHAVSERDGVRSERSFTG